MAENKTFTLLIVFRRQRLVDMDLLDYLISRIVKTAIELGVIKSRTLIIDATHTSSKYNPYAPVDLLQLRSKNLRLSIYTNTRAGEGASPLVIFLLFCYQHSLQYN